MLVLQATAVATADMTRAKAPLQASTPSEAAGLPRDEHLGSAGRTGSAAPLSFGDRHPVLRGIGVTYASGVAGGAAGLSIARGMGAIAEKTGATIFGDRMVLQPHFTTGGLKVAGFLEIGAMAAGAYYSYKLAHKAH